ncbi:MAG TPA: hypothetical protein DEP18_04265 [Flavobacteriales bacterium]|nr:hypothetical protein [Flavobacteriales bacterium]HRE73901.1 T9SS type A sorting domain-containing protein [Flavobacteriales bacterium]HRE97551.1 T9SS type A sorting domain-containing protein [Flavobacteriales bacterium]HRJ35702.1 T9SS type A sorting domain-containing protein [Flavobacteriales bacterium]HRJ38319.1 T9SS type A sorting domain-containing protein [Flavobacteriales bacterium]
MRRFFALFSFVIAASPIVAQINVQWESRFNDIATNTPQIVADMFVDPAGNVYVTGSSYSVANGYNIVTIKYNNSGAQLWINNFNGSGNGLDEARALFVDASGNVYVTGYSFRGGSNYDYTTIKYNSAGAQQWQQYYDAGASLFDDASDIVVDATGNVYVTGSGQIASNNTNIRTVKYNSAGTQQWAANFSSSGSNLDQGKIIALDAAGDVYVAGNAFNTGQDLNYRVLKYNAVTGAQVWTVQYNHTLNSYDYPTDMKLDASGNVYVTGYSYNGAVSDDDIHTIRINSAGTITHTVIFNGTANGADISNAMQIDASGNVYVVGRAKNSGTAEDFLVIKYDANLNQIWSDSYNGLGGNYDQASDIAIDNSGNVYATGYSYLPSSNNDYFTIKYNPTTGARIWTTRFNGTANNSDQAKVINVDASGNVYVSGDSRGSGTGSDYSTIKYCQLFTNAGSDQQICIGGNVQLNATGGSTWNWTPSTGLSSTTIPNPVANPSSTTTYIVSSTDGNGCTDLDTIQVVVNPLPGPVITPDGPTSFCVGDSVKLSASGFTSYSWNTGSMNPEITVMTAGTYTVTVTDAMMCNNSTSVTVTVNSLPTVDAGTVPPVCAGSSVQLQATGAQTYLWNANPTLSNITIANPIATPNTSQWYYVTGTDANGCSNYDSVQVSLNPLPATPTITFVSANYTLVTNQTSGVQWYLNGVPVAGGTTQTINVLNNGQYWVTYTNANGCTSINSDTITILDVSVDELEAIGLVVFPNPVSDNLTIKANDVISAAIRVCDLAGRVMIQLPFSTGNRFQVDVSGLVAGTYLILFETESGISVQRIIKQ